VEREAQLETRLDFGPRNPTWGKIHFRERRNKNTKWEWHAEPSTCQKQSHSEKDFLFDQNFTEREAQLGTRLDFRLRNPTRRKIHLWKGGIKYLGRRSPIPLPMPFFFHPLVHTVHYGFLSPLFHPLKHLPSMGALKDRSIVRG
jgi:hypothetical protein